MGQTCTKNGGDDVTDKRDTDMALKRTGKSKQRRSSFGGDGTKSKKKHAHKGSGDDDSDGGDSSDVDQRSPKTKAAPAVPDGQFTVVHQIEALQHTMKPAVPVVSSELLHSDFRQFTDLFPRHMAATAVASCKRVKPPGHILVAGENCSLCLVNYETGHILRRWCYAHSRDINTVTEPLSTGHFATGSRDKVVKVWKVDHDEPIAVLKGHTLNVPSVDMNGDGSLVVSGSKDNTVRLWDVNREAELYCGDVKLNIVHFVRFVPGMTHCVAQGGEDLAVRLWDIRQSTSGSATMSLVNTLTDMDYYPVCCETLESRPHTLLTGHNGVNGHGSYIAEWDLRMQKRVRLYCGHRDTVTHLSMAAENVYGPDIFFSTSADSTVGVWPLEDDPNSGDVQQSIDHQFLIQEGRITGCTMEDTGDFITSHANGCVVVFRPVKAGDAVVPTQRYRYIGVLPQGE